MHFNENGAKRWPGSLAATASAKAWPQRGARVRPRYRLPLRALRTSGRLDRAREDQGGDCTQGGEDHQHL